MSNLTVGGTNQGEANIILNGQKNGIEIESSSNNLIIGNAIGTDITGTLTGGNSGAGINFTGTSERNQIGGLGTGQGNLIANNLTHGISMSVATARYNPIRGNSIFCNTGKGIQLSSLGNENIAVPKINSLSGTSTVFGTALPSAKVDLYYFATCNPCSGTSLQGKTYIATATADGAGNWSYQGGVSNLQITATQTNANNSTSEFSPREVLVLAGATTCGAVSDVTIQLTGATSGDAYQAYVGGTLVASTVSGNGNLGLTISTANLAIGNNPVTITSSVFGCGIFTTSTTNIRFNPVFSTVSASVNPICPGLNTAVTISGISSLGQYYLTTTGGMAISAASTGSGSVVLPVASAGFGVGNYPLGVYASIAGCAPVLVGNSTLSVNTFSDAGSSLTSATICGGAISATLTLSGATIGDQYSLFVNNLSQISVTAT
ncbi:MAG: hypothetical protein K2Q22_03435, partial [Cytophagales bacterium]|nr:hypothetical protein [Cytophagales bacterium]